MLKAKPAVLYAMYLAACGGMVFAISAAVYWNIYSKPGDIGFIVFLSLFALALLVIFAIALRQAAAHAWRVATIKIGDTAILGGEWHYVSNKYVPYTFLRVTVKNPQTRENPDGGVTRTDGKRFAFGDDGWLPMGEEVRAIAFPDRKHVIVEYGTAREYRNDNELPAGTWFKLTRGGFINLTNCHYRTQARLREEQRQREAEELDRLAASEQEALRIIRSTGQHTVHDRS